jgi:hypothetical protein
MPCTDGYREHSTTKRTLFYLEPRSYSANNHSMIIGKLTYTIYRNKCYRNNLAKKK